MISWKFFFLCLVYSFEQNNAWWCDPEEDFDILIYCLIGERIQAFDLTMTKFYGRLQCARLANCIPKPWDIPNKSIKTLRNFADCMEEIAERSREFDMETLRIEEINCRKKLAEYVLIRNNSMSSYYSNILPEAFSTIK